MEFKNIFTQYDESIEKTTEIDTLGFSILWTHFGQEIFGGKISSVTWDVRGFNINLFNHFIIKNLRKDSSNTIKILFEKNPQEAVEKLTIILENLLTWSWFKSQAQWGKSKKGLLGTSKAISSWEINQINLNLNDNIKSLELLKRQKTLGTSGRYKGSFVKIGFFESNYDFDNYFEGDLYKEVQSIVEKNRHLNSLYKELILFFKDEDLKIDASLVKLFTAVFKETSTIASDTKDFWLDKLGFEKEESKTLYQNIDIYEPFSLKEVKNIIISNKESSKKIKIISILEPKLSYLDAVLNYLIFFDTKNIQNLSKEKYFSQLENLNFDEEIAMITKPCGAKDRLIELNKVNSIKSLIKYHAKIMEDRGHTPWITVDENDTIQTTINKIKGKEELEKKLEMSLENISWIHDYYLLTVFNIKKGLNSETL